MWRAQRCAVYRCVSQSTAVLRPTQAVNLRLGPPLPQGSPYVRLGAFLGQMPPPSWPVAEATFNREPPLADAENVGTSPRIEDGSLHISMGAGTGMQRSPTVGQAGGCGLVPTPPNGVRPKLPKLPR